jgi:Flp pilus assembly protein TadB
MLSRPVYESLPWVYLTAGGLALLISYLQSSSSLSLALGLPGLLAVLAGVVVVLRRRGYRRLRAQYGAPDALDAAIARSDARSSAPTFR